MPAEPLTLAPLCAPAAAETRCGWCSSGSDWLQKIIDVYKRQVYTVLPLSGALIVVYSVLNIIDLATDSVEEHSSTSAE